MKIHTIFRILTLLVMTHLPFRGATQSLNKAQILEAAQAYFRPGIATLHAFLQIPNDGHFPEQIDQNVNWCLAAFKERQFDVQVLATAGAPLVFAEKVYHPGAKSLLFYLQIDGQPVDSSKWFQESPFQPALKRLNEQGEWEIMDWSAIEKDFDPDWRIFARSASDSKGPAVAFMTALDIIREKGIIPAYNIKVIMDFQEELGSPDLPAAVVKYRDLLDAEMLLIMDGTRHVSNLPTLTFGARGIATVTIKVFGARGDLHSGQYGNFAPNPVFKLSKLIAGMKDDEGRVIIPGFYDGIHLSDKEKRMLNDIPEDVAEIKQTLGIAEADQVGATYQEALQYPSLNIRGLRAAWVGKEVRTLIPAEAIAEIDMRLVPESDGQRLVDLIKQYVVDQGYHLVNGEPTDEERSQYAKLASLTYRLGSKPFRTDLDSPIGEWLSSAMTRTFGDRFVKMRTTGGSQPMAPFISTLDIPAVSVRIPNPDNSIHAPNENLRLGNFLEGIQMCLGVLTE
ncbi:MAG: M20/M25/M40 family metallo-hydrolase [Saprospiraceae bacterium]